jgi:hypothetical protein
LKDDKVDLLVDPDLKDNYDYKEVEELIQVYPGHAYLISLCATGDERFILLYVYSFTCQKAHREMQEGSWVMTLFALEWNICVKDNIGASMFS